MPGPLTYQQPAEHLSVLRRLAARITVGWPERTTVAGGKRLGADGRCLRHTFLLPATCYFTRRLGSELGRISSGRGLQRGPGVLARVTPLPL